MWKVLWKNVGPVALPTVPILWKKSWGIICTRRPGQVLIAYLATLMQVTSYRQVVKDASRFTGLSFIIVHPQHSKCDLLSQLAFGASAGSGSQVGQKANSHYSSTQTVLVYQDYSTHICSVSTQIFSAGKTYHIGSECGVWGRGLRRLAPLYSNILCCKPNDKCHFAWFSARAMQLREASTWPWKVTSSSERGPLCIGGTRHELRLQRARPGNTLVSSIAHAFVSSRFTEDSISCYKFVPLVTYYQM